MFKVNHKNADKFVERQQKMGVDVFWDGWTMCFFRPEPMGEFSKAGSLHNGQWGYINRFETDDEGVYNLDTRNIRFPEKPRGRR